MKNNNKVQTVGARGTSPEHKGGAYSPTANSDAREACLPKADSPRPTFSFYKLL